jgi:hypothetical protein
MQSRGSGEGSLHQGDIVTAPKYPYISVKLSGTDGNAFAIMAKVRHALKSANVSSTEINAYMAESMSGDYDHLLRTAIKWVQVH